MMFSSSMSVVEYYLLHRFPVPYGNLLLLPHFLHDYYSDSWFWIQFVCLVCSCLLHRNCIHCCHHQPALCEEVDQSARACFTHHLHLGFHDLCQRNFSWYHILKLAEINQNPYGALDSYINNHRLPAGGVGISNIVHKIECHQYMGFESLCNYGA